MKKRISGLFFGLLTLLVVSSSALGVEVSLLGPLQYDRTTGAPNIYSKSFRGVEGKGTLIIRNGDANGGNRITSAGVFINDVTVFNPDDFKKKADVLTAEVNLAESNTIKVELRGAPGTYISVEIIQDIDPPVVTIQATPASVILGNTAELAWTSENADICEITPDIGLVDLSGRMTVSPQATTTYTITAIGLGGTATAETVVSVFLPPTVTIDVDPDTIIEGQTATLTWTSANAENCVIQPGLGSVPLNGTTTVSPNQTTIYTITASGPGGIVTAEVQIEVQPIAGPPRINFTPSSITISRGQSASLSWTAAIAQKVYIDNGIGTVPTTGSISVTPEHTTVYSLTATGVGGSSSAQVFVHVNGNPDPQPEGTFGHMYNDLIPADASVFYYEEKRFAIITGEVVDLQGQPIEGVTVSIHKHPEYGTTTTDAQGDFSLPVEGGAVMTVVYHKQGLVTSSRQVNVPWNDFVIAETIAMLTEDPASTSVNFDGSPETVVTHRSTPYTDEFGTRSATLVFTGDNQAYLSDENGNAVQSLNTITARATIYPTPASMPAVLPPNSAFTYCVELAVDGAQRVKFSKPVTTWVDNFLGFDVGEIVPVGYFDRDRGVWVPSDNGIVVRLLDTNGDGKVDAIDTNGDGQPDDLDGDGTYTNEAIGLEDSARYASGTTFWRVAITHFTPWDCNWPYGPPDDAIPPNPPTDPDMDEQKKENEDSKGCYNSFVEERSRIFHEDIPIAGTDMTLHYASNRVEGYKTIISVPVSGPTVPFSLKGIFVKVEIAGRTFMQSLSPLPNQKATFFWNGLDYLGNKTQGVVTAHVHIGFVYDTFYYSPDEFAKGFAQAGRNNTGIKALKEATFWKDFNIKTTVESDRGSGIIAEGWTLSLHHRLYHDNDSVLISKGDGSFAKVGFNIITTVAGTGSRGDSGDGGLAVGAQLNRPTSVTVDASGSLYIVDRDNRRIRRVNTDGVITTVAGGGDGGDGGPATEAWLEWPQGIAVDASGNLYISDSISHCIRKVDTSGIITTVAGNSGYGFGGYSGDGGPAIQAQLNEPYDVAVDASGSLYISDSYNHCIRKVDTSGIITTVAGNGLWGEDGDGGPAVQARISFPKGIAVDTSGNLYIATHNRIRKVNTNGVITTVAGNGSWGYNGGGGPALQTALHLPCDMALDAFGNLFVADMGDEWPSNMSNDRICKVAQAPGTFANAITVSGQLAVAEGSEIGHVMSTSGLHIRTIDLYTGVSLYEFSYNQEGKLVSITDQFGNTVHIERAGGSPMAVISPDGMRTELSINSANHLAQVTYPGGVHYNFHYTADGLLTEKIDPKGNHFRNGFDSQGRLVNISDDEGGLWRYSTMVEAGGDNLVEKLSAEGNLTTYRDHTDPLGAYQSTITDPNGAQTLYSRSADGLTAQKTTSCGMSLAFQYGLDSEYGFDYVKQMSETTPSGLKRSITHQKTYVDSNADKIPDQITEIAMVNGKATTISTDALQSSKFVTSPAGRTVTTLYDPTTLLTTSLSIPELFETTFSYNERGRITSIITNTRETAFAYDSRGNLSSVTDPEYHTTTYGYDDLGRVTAVYRPDTSDLFFSYDDNGNMTILTNPNTIAHGFGYNRVNMFGSYQTPLSGGYSFLYDKDRRLVRKTFPSGRQIYNLYDGMLLSQIQTPEGNIDYTYLCSSKVGRITKDGESVTYGYDGKLLTSEVISGTLNQNLTFTYNNDFNVKSLTYAGTVNSFTYDNDGLLTGSGVYAISRNALNGLPESVSGGSFHLSRSFNGYAEISDQTATVGGQALLSWSVSPDNTGRILSKTETVGGVTVTFGYDYDSMGRLLTVTKNGVKVEEYDYNLNGSREYETNTLRGITGRTLAYSDEDHLLTAGGVSYQYDRDGFLTSKTEGAGSTGYTYSSRGELLNVALPDGTYIEYENDPLGRRIAKRVNGTMTEKYLWQGLTRLLATYDGADNLIQRFEYADERMPVAMTRGGVTYYLTYDQVGSLRLVANASGNVVKRIDYDSFGNIITDTNPAFKVPFGFAGGLHDRNTGLVRFGYRDYDPETGRWTAKDPILFAGGDTDLYGYVLNNPVNLIDPYGLHIIQSGFHSHSEKNSSAYATTVGPYTRYNQNFDNLHPLKQESVEYHESLHREYGPFMGEQKVREQEINFIKGQKNEYDPNSNEYKILDKWLKDNEDSYKEDYGKQCP